MCDQLWNCGVWRQRRLGYPSLFMIQIDGSYGEGGGQIIRTSVSLAAITGREIRIDQIRAKRSKPGLQPQHLMSVKAAAELCQAETYGAAVGSTSLTFKPTRPVRAGDYRFDIGTAGSAPLVAQTVLVPLAFTGQPCKVTVTGGTHNPMAPSSDYLEHIYAPALREMGVSVAVNSPRAGFYPAGGGLLEVELTGSASLHPIHRLDRGPLKRLQAIVTTSGLADHVFNRARTVIESRLPMAKVVHEEKPSSGAGAAVVLVAEHEGGSAGFTGLGEKGKPMERVAEEAIDLYEEWAGQDAPVDEHLADQLVLPAVFASGQSSWRTSETTEHLRSVLWLVEHFMPVSYEIGPTVRVIPRRNE